jgi:hypothetical protein
VYSTDLLPSAGDDASIDAGGDAAEAPSEVRGADDVADGARPDISVEMPDTAGDVTPVDSASADTADASVRSDVVESSAAAETGVVDAPGAETNDATGTDGARDASDGGDSGDAGVGTVVFVDDFERNLVGMSATGWTRIGGSATDWEVAADTGLVFQQDRSLSTTLRLCYAGPSRSGAGSVSARVKVLGNGTSSVPTALLCLRYAINGSGYECLGLEPGVGLQIKTLAGDGPVWPTGVSMNLWYGLKLSLDASGMLSAYVDGTLLGTFRPAAAVDYSPVAVGTQSALAAFDDVVLTTP